MVEELLEFLPEPGVWVLCLNMLLGFISLVGIGITSPDFNCARKPKAKTPTNPHPTYAVFSPARIVSLNKRRW